MATLLLRLCGPIQGYGTFQSLDSVRDTVSVPSKSAVIGLICAAFGRDRCNNEGWPSLTDLCKLRMAVRVNREGKLTEDTQVGNIAVNRKESRNQIFTKYFLADADFYVGLEGQRDLLEVVDGAIRKPYYGLCLGRRGCVPSRPVFVQDGIKECELIPALKAIPGKCVRFVEEVDFGQGTYRVQDVPLSFDPAKRSFVMREVKEWKETVCI